MGLNDLRELVREKIAFNTDLADRVWNSRIIALEEVELPAAVIHTPSELSDGYNLTVSLEILIFCDVKHGEDLGDNLDRLNEQVRECLRNFWDDDNTFVGRYQGRDTRFVPDAKRPHAISKLVYELETVDE